jgi:DNA-binding CsgD family transcriptional regulator
MQRLTTNELSVLALASSGLTTKETAARLGISVNTTKYHLTNVYRKLGVRNRVEALKAYGWLLQHRPSAQVRTILESATRVAAQIASAVAGSRAAYFLIEGGMVRPFIEQDSLNASGARGFPLGENHHFAEIVATRRPRVSVVAARPLGPAARDSVKAVGVTGGAGVPIVVNDSVHGILAIGMRGEEVPVQLFRRLVELGQLVELALTAVTGIELAKVYGRTEAELPAISVRPVHSIVSRTASLSSRQISRKTT